MFTRIELGLAAVCTAWAAASLAGEGAALAFAPALGLPVLLYRRRPLVAALGVALAIFATYASGVSEENPASLAAGLTVTYALGRHVAGLAGYALVPLLALALTAVAPTAVVDVVFAAFVLTLAWACGLLVRRRGERARSSEKLAAELAARDPSALAVRVVAEERGRLAGDALAVVRGAVESMQQHAAAAGEALDTRALSAIQDEGRAAVAELRRLLGLLRAEEDGPAPAEPERAAGRRRPGRADLAVAAALAALGLVDIAIAADPSPGSVGLTFAFAGAAAFARVDSVAACVLAAVPPLLAVALDAPLVYGFSTGPACGVLAWSAAADGRVISFAALGFTAAVTLVVMSAEEPGNEAILLSFFALSALAGHAWGRRERSGYAAASAVERLRAEHEAVAERAVRAERLRIARELHDVVSHAVGAMVLQAGAALALRERRPDDARAAVRRVQAAGSEAMGELSVLFGLIEAGAVGSGSPGHAAPAERDTSAALEALAERMRGGGLRVELALPERLPDDPDALAAAYRVVQEALTNAARHAPGSRVSVAAAAKDGLLEVRIEDDGGAAGRGEAAGQGGGFGLVGLDERLRALGGELSAGPLAGGGFAVHARVPVREPERVPA